LWAQHSSGSGIAVQINHEAHLDPTTAQLSFRVMNSGEIAVSEPVTITAWVRSLPNQEILLTAELVTLNGPAGAAPPGAIRWSGVMEHATGGATAANCTSGKFGAGPPKPLITGWSQSGIAKCKVTFTLVTEAEWPQGIYTGQVVLKLIAQ